MMHLAKFIYPFDLVLIFNRLQRRYKSHISTNFWCCLPGCWGSMHWMIHSFYRLKTKFISTYFGRVVLLSCGSQINWICHNISKLNPDDTSSIWHIFCTYFKLILYENVRTAKNCVFKIWSADIRRVNYRP